MSNLTNNNLIVSEEKYDTEKGTPKFTVKEKGDSLRIRCEMTGRHTKDNGFLEGTYFAGRIKEADGRVELKGIILTAPIYHFIVFALIVLLIYQCFAIGGINIVPILLFCFSLFMFKDEFAKQELIKRYIFRALKITYRQVSSTKK